jgi:hypothetical protein
MANKWIEHIRTYAKSKNISYSCAVSDPECSKTYKEKQEKSKPEKKAEPNTYEANKELNKKRRVLTPAEKAQKEKEFIDAYSSTIGNEKAQDAYEEKWKNTELLPENKKEWDEQIKKFQALQKRAFSLKSRRAKSMLKGRNTLTTQEKKDKLKEEKELKEKTEKDKLNTEPPFQVKRKKIKGLANLS